MTPTRDTLYVSPSLRVRRAAGGRVVLTRKFIDGMARYRDDWPGPVAVLAEASDAGDSNLDHVEVEPDALPFKLHLVNYADAGELRRTLADARVVMASLDHKQADLPAACAPIGVPVVFALEYTEKTRLQILAADVRNPLIRLRRAMWIKGMEKRYRAAAGRAAALQCNGTPTYEAYAPYHADRLLYFDTRVTADMLANDEDLATRTKHLLGGAPLRLAFSGRLIAMKGADHLAPVAAELAKRNVPFTFDVFGGGDLKPKIERQIASLGLKDKLFLRGVLDFEKELMPRVTHEVDLFVCCHPQGDPSCTYLETMSCGTPIVGYDNEAFAGLVRQSNVGWPTPLGDARALAERIASLNQDRPALVRAATQSRDFAARHTFEKTFRARVEHLLAVSAQPATVGAGS